MTRLLLVLTSFLIGTISFAQTNKAGNGIIKGSITTSDGKPAAYVTVKIERSKWGSISNEEGTYTINNVKAGTWKIKVSAVGMISQEKEASVAAGETAQVDFTLKENAEQMESVTVSYRNLNKENRFVAKMPLKNLENPQVYSTVSSETMKQQGIVNYDDAMRNVPGISRTWESTGRAGDGAAYFALRGFDAQPFLYNGLPGLVSGNLDPANIEEIEVLKGPSGTLFGGAFFSYGGMINTVTKKPYFDFGGEIGYNFGSFGLNRVTADFNTPLSKTEKIALRVNTAYHTENSFQDAGFKKSFFVAPSLAYEVNDRLSFLLVTEILDEERAVPPVFFHSDRVSPLDYKNLQELNLNRNLSFTSNDLTIKNPRFSMQGQMIYKLSDKWTSQTVFSRGNVKSKGIYTYLWDDVSGDEWFSQYFKSEDQVTNTTDIQQNFNGDFKIGGMRNRILVGLDYFQRNVIDQGSGWGFGRSVNPQGEEKFEDPFPPYGQLDPVYLTKASVDKLLSTLAPNNSNLSNASYSAYASDVINITPALMAMASVRVDYFDSKGEKTSGEGKYSQWAVSPKFGLLYQPILNKVSLFANYMNGFVNVAPRQIESTGKFVSFEPEEANQLEYGVKANLFSGKLLTTISVYDIKVSNRVQGDGIQSYSQGGKVRSRGVEVELTANPLRGLSVIAGYSYNDNRIVDGDEKDFYSQPGRRPGGQGPKDLVNLWATYTVPQGPLKNFGIGIGGNYASEYLVIDNSTTGRFYLPSYTLVNAGLFYNSSKFRIGVNVNNLNDEVYYIGYWSVNPQKPRNFVASVAYKF